MFTRSNRYLTSSNHITLSRQPKYGTLQLKAQRQRPDQHRVLTSWGTQRRCEHVCHDTSFFLFARNTKPSSRHITRFSHFSSPYKTGSPLPRVAHRHFDPQRTAPLLASFQNAKLHIALWTVAWTFQSLSSTSLPTISMVFSWLCQNLNRSSSDKTQDIVHVHTDLRNGSISCTEKTNCTRSRECGSEVVSIQLSHWTQSSTRAVIARAQ